MLILYYYFRRAPKVTSQGERASAKWAGELCRRIVFWPKQTIRPEQMVFGALLEKQQPAWPPAALHLAPPSKPAASVTCAGGAASLQRRVGKLPDVRLIGAKLGQSTTC